MAHDAGYAEIHGHRLHYRVAGSGPPLLLVMGIGGHLDMWDPLTEQLDGFETIAFDLPGCGASPVPRLPMRMWQLARLADGLVARLGYRQVDALGYSFGGMVVQKLAQQHRARVRRVVLAATTPGVTAVPPPPRNLARMLTPRRYHSKSYFMDVAPSLLGGRLARDPEELAANFEARSRHPPTYAGYYGQVYSVWGWTSLPWLWRLRQPTLVLAGTDDRLVPLSNARLLACVIPDARLHVVEGGGHVFLLDQAADVAPAIRDFLLA